MELKHHTWFHLRLFRSIMYGSTAQISGFNKLGLGYFKSGEQSHSCFLSAQSQQD